MATNWLPSSPNALLPPNAVVGGYDSDGSVIYVARSYHEGKLLPAKVIPDKRAAYISWAGAEYSKNHYELLVGDNYTWQPCFGANIPPNAVRMSEVVVVDGSEPLFIGRGHYGNSLIVGKIQPSHAALYVSCAGREITLNKYEILVFGGEAAHAIATKEQGDPLKFEEHKWIPSTVYENVPPQAVAGGNDSDGDVIYIGRAFHEGDMLVANVISSKQIAFVSFRGAELPKDNFEILCGHHLVWRHSYNNLIPERAVLCGKTSLGQPVYIGRGHYEGSLRVGKISSVHRALFIPFRGVERRLETYEILVEKKLTAGWNVSALTNTLPSAPSLTTSAKPCPYQLLETSSPYSNLITPQPYPELKPPMPMPSDPPPPYVAVASSQAVSMPSSIPSSHFPKPTHNYPTPRPAETYPGPAQHFPNPSPSSNMWVSSAPGRTPGNAVHAGHDVDMHTIYVGRAFHNGDCLPGKAIPSRSCAYVSYQGQEIQKTSYEILVGEHYTWVPAINGYAVGAVEAGRTASGELLYVGRAYYQGSLTCGKIQRSHNVLFIPFGGREVRISHGYEILVDRNRHNCGKTGALIY